MASIAGPSYFPVSALARLPLSMLTIGILTYVSSVSGVAVGGAVAAIAGIGVAVGAPILGSASDRWGQKPTLLVCALCYSAALVWVIAAGSAENAGPMLSCAAFAAGLTAPQSGPMTRVRWIRRLGGRGPAEAATLDAAQSYESTMDEMSFVFGPAIVGLLAAATTPVVPLWTALVLALLVVPWFALHPTVKAAAPQARVAHRRANAVVHETQPHAPAVQRLPYGLISVLLLGMLSIGIVFGSLATVSTAFADETGHSGAGGLVYATMGITSGLAALSVSRWSPRFSHSRRWVVCSVVLVAVLCLLWLPEHPWQLSVLFLLVGAPIGPVLVTVFAIAGHHTPLHRLGLIMTLLAAGITLGTSVGNWLSGALADADGHAAALWITLAAGVLLVAVGLVQAALASRQRPATPQLGEQGTEKVS
ncbi:MAG: MFS transporter [Galactobacter sp.]